MKSCDNCSAFSDPECTIFNKIPPEGYAEKCKHFDGEETVVPRCDETCSRYQDGYCMRQDHPDYKYNFIKVEKGALCLN